MSWSSTLLELVECDDQEVSAELGHLAGSAHTHAVRPVNKRSCWILLCEMRLSQSRIHAISRVSNQEASVNRWLQMDCDLSKYSEPHALQELR